MRRKISQRKTSQRRALLKAFEQADRPLSPQEALELATPHARGLGIATVYRNLKDLADRNVLKAVNLPGESTARYELWGKGTIIISIAASATRSTRSKAARAISNRWFHRALCWRTTKWCSTACGRGARNGARRSTSR